MAGALPTKIDVSQLRRFAGALRGADRELVGDLKASVEVIGAKIVSSASRAAPVFTGEGAGSIRQRGAILDVTGDVIRIEDVVQTNRVSMIVQEEGRRAGAAAPPLEPIQRWVTLKVRRGAMKQRMDSYVDARGRRRKRKRTLQHTAYLVAEGIRHRGIKAKQFLRAAGLAHEGELVRLVDEATREFEARVEGGG